MSALDLDDPSTIPEWPACAITRSPFGVRLDAVRGGRHMSLTFPSSQTLAVALEVFDSMTSASLALAEAGGPVLNQIHVKDK